MADQGLEGFQIVISIEPYRSSDFLLSGSAFLLGDSIKNDGTEDTIGGSLKAVFEKVEEWLARGAEISPDSIKEYQCAKGVYQTE